MRILYFEKRKIMMYEITQDCRIANQDYEKGQIVSKEEVGGRFPSVMKEAEEKEAKTPAKKSKKTDPEVADTPEEPESESQD